MRSIYTITKQHAEALEGVNTKMSALALATTNINTVIQANGNIDFIKDELEDDDQETPSTRDLVTAGEFPG